MPQREFVWSYGAPDSVGEKREYPEDHRGRDTVRHDWDHDDEEDFQNGRRQDTRHHCSLSRWARASRCQGGLDDCYNSNGRHRTSTPFRRHGQGLTSTKSWVPKVKAKTISFGNPLISAVWLSGFDEGTVVAENVRLAKDRNFDNKAPKAAEESFRPVGGNIRDNIDALLI